MRRSKEENAEEMQRICYQSLFACVDTACRSLKNIHKNSKVKVDGINELKCTHHFCSCARIDSIKKDLQPPYESSYKIVNRIEKVFRILRHGKEVSVSVNQLKPACFSKELVDIPAGLLGKKKAFSQPNEFLNTGEETSTES
ncbi:hypothetical protein NPIL_149951 [Nephila pilipes]|uniref:Uncharacterized protein n=1 Tax=Nephila pilipes TaxID=299642 RepID=A0A8X6TA64_NEPPI|nr:hypothetical protein NPIL_149951 [Nephila pilipes]